MFISLVKLPTRRTFCFPDGILQFSILAEAGRRHSIYVSKDAGVIRSVRSLKLGESLILHNRVLDEDGSSTCWDRGRSYFIC